ncbi:MAG TPA: AI-2E family transporter [Burkholderiales bacterium]|nr:AI-2E family transporter [Burkholderiales bacterium]
MTQVQVAAFSFAFTALILLAAFSILEPFLLSILWAGIIAVAAWPMFLKIRSRVGERSGRAALASTVIVAFTIAAPMLLIGIFVLRDVVQAVAFIKGIDDTGMPQPPWIAEFPLIGEFLAQKWQQYLARPRQISSIMHSVVEARLNAVQDLARTVLLDITARVAIMFFALWVLYFLLRDGERISARIHRLGYKWLPRRWPLYAHQIPSAVRSSVNGLILVALGEGVVMSLLFWALGVPAPVSLGTLTALVALIPVAAPALIALISLAMFAAGHAAAAVALFVLGTVIILLAENLLRPILAKGSSDIPFLLTLFGIFGGLALMGIAGVVIGPVVLALLLVLVREAEIEEGTDLEF